jgi:hypothetical protein
LSTDGPYQPQLEVCERYGVQPFPAPADRMLGFARNVRDGLEPTNGLRHPPQGDATGWYIWAGEELSSDPDFFVPIHVAHLGEWCPQALPYLALPPGWRFLITPGHEDAWQDPSLLDA